MVIIFALLFLFVSHSWAFGVGLAWILIVETSNMLLRKRLKALRGLTDVAKFARELHRKGY